MEDESEKVVQGDRELSKLEVRGDPFLIQGALQLLHYLRAWTCVALQGRREVCKRGAQAWKYRTEVCVRNAAMHWGFWCESSSGADRIPRGVSR